MANRLDELICERRGVERCLLDAQADVEDFQSLAASDREQILDLGSDLATLLPLAREQNPKLLRALMRELVEVIRFRRISGFACEIEIVFPGGAVLEEVFMTRRMNGSRAALEYAAGRLADGEDPGQIATALNRARPKNHSVPWDEERVITAPVALQHQAIPPLRQGEHHSLAEIASEQGVDPVEVFIPAVHGDLGPGYYDGGDLHVSPSLEELHRWIPGAARKYVAAETGWPEKLVITRSEVSERIGLTRGGVMYRARRGSGAMKDATGAYWVCASDFE